MTTALMFDLSTERAKRAAPKEPAPSARTVRMHTNPAFMPEVTYSYSGNPNYAHYKPKAVLPFPVAPIKSDDTARRHVVQEQRFSEEAPKPYLPAGLHVQSTVQFNFTYSKQLATFSVDLNTRDAETLMYMGLEQMATTGYFLARHVMATDDPRRDMLQSVLAALIELRDAPHA